VNAQPTSAVPALSRRLPIGAEPIGDDGTRFRVWAPRSTRASVVLVNADGSPQAEAPLVQPDASGHFSGVVADARAGSRYWLQLDDGRRYPDPASRFQPEGPHGPSEVVDPAFAWRDHDWPGVTMTAPVVYELHVGTFTSGGTYAAAAAELPALAALGISIVEMMPVAEFPGRFGWGYDGVLPFAPSHLYGRPADLRGFVDAAHALGLAVVLDVVYNHLGPDGNYLKAFAESYFRSGATEWGDGFNFDGEDAGPVREYVRANARYWISEFHFDGLRLDATHAIHDESPRHILADITDDVRASAPGRRTWTVAENEPQDVTLVEPASAGGGGLDAMWNDDFHHAARVAMTGRREAYFTDYLGSPQEFVSAARHGFLYRGQRYRWQNQNRGTPAADIAPRRLVTFLQNHDQIANSRTGARLEQLTNPGLWRAMTTLLLLGPWTPMLFQGQEFGASAPFLYFADHSGDLAEAVRQGRRTFLSQFATWRDLTPQDLDDPSAERTFLRSKIDLDERRTHAAALELHRSLIAMRREDPAFADDTFVVDGAVIASKAFALRYLRRDAPPSPADRLVVVNMGAEVLLTALSEPLLAPPPASRWTVRWSSNAAAVGGDGGIDPFLADGWRLPATSALVLAPEPV
jgi:maltooligosyltrehalose trehalohydrolase